MFYAYRDLILRLAPSLYWPLDDEYEAADLSGNGRNGSGAGGISPGGYTPPPSLGGMTDFGGGIDVITSSYNPYVNGTARTFCGWARRDSISGFHALIGSNGTFGGTGEFTLYGDNGSASVNLLAGGVSVASWANALPAGSGRFWALVADESANTVELFIDGVSQGVQSVAWSYPAGSTQFWAGAYASGAAFDGRMAGIAVFEGALSAAEISGLHAAENYTAAVLALSPALFWPLDAISGATDRSGNSRNGTGAGGVVVGGPPAPSALPASSTDFDGTDDLITSSYNPFTNGTTRTFAGWAYCDTNSGLNSLMGSGAAAGSQVLLRLSSGGQNVVFGSQGSTGAVTWTSAWPGNTQWVHWVLIFDEGGDTASLYINGALTSAQAITRAYAASPGNFRAGAQNSTGADPFDGKMAHVAVFERALTPGEILTIYKAGAAGASRSAA